MHKFKEPRGNFHFQDCHTAHHPRTYWSWLYDRGRVFTWVSVLIYGFPAEQDSHRLFSALGESRRQLHLWQICKARSMGGDAGLHLCRGQQCWGQGSNAEARAAAWERGSCLLLHRSVPPRAAACAVLQQPHPRWHDCCYSTCAHCAGRWPPWFTKRDEAGNTSIPTYQAPWQGLICVETCALSLETYLSNIPNVTWSQLLCFHGFMS